MQKCYQLLEAQEKQDILPSLLSCIFFIALLVVSLREKDAYLADRSNYIKKSRMLAKRNKLA